MTTRFSAAMASSRRRMLGRCVFGYVQIHRTSSSVILYGQPGAMSGRERPR
jgi:hypothetical protein